MATPTAHTAIGAAGREVAELFADYLEGDAARPALALSQGALPEVARNALERSLEAFGHEAPACTYVTLAPRDADAEGGEIALDPQALFLLAESLDPLYIIATDAHATQALGQAYRVTLEANAPARIFGRPAVAFKDLSSNLATEQAKQQAWRLLKTLNA